MKYLLALLLSMSAFATPMKDMVTQVESSVVALYGNNSQCSGVQVRTPHNKILILSAGHCSILLENNKLRAMSSDGQAIDVKLVAMSENSDLMLLTPITENAIELADSITPGDMVITMTHGMNQPLFATFGIAQEERMIPGMGRAVTNEAERKQCLSRKMNRIESVMFVAHCVSYSTLQMTTAWAKGGSSGGPAINESGKIIGILSVGSENASGLVRLSDIKSFLASY